MTKNIYVDKVQVFASIDYAYTIGNATSSVSVFGDASLGTTVQRWKLTVDELLAKTSKYVVDDTKLVVKFPDGMTEIVDKRLFNEGLKEAFEGDDDGRL